MWGEGQSDGDNLKVQKNTTDQGREPDDPAT